jgi:hypothetical protein
MGSTAVSAIVQLPVLGVVPQPVQTCMRILQDEFTWPTWVPAGQYGNNNGGR